MRITKQMIVDAGGKLVALPRRLSARHVTDRLTDKHLLLCVVIHTPYGEHFKEITSQSVLDQVRITPMACEPFELTAAAVEHLRAAINPK